ncbi:TIGR02221 family CRISPR-associated protein [Desulfotignum phosphitoxidans]|uniref:CRISPR-associated protein, TM1812 family n=1 Tax=Desulfotignum phosphitoxidans DSM 13687 TaxID=1286635 RepID=S0FTV7_9BACT|nr:TIGR02221 family CRISPR-associated protein [Desulfotignum phosphitoxidans]EMS78528.1 CRISPR-associated protein, TM1812 family [Desulfotignum phosphitoxidans DSM 13687]EMS80211.1 CRISPR-associated protein, TM1812 family [Desulfotignum phosphitoxidans DSM 13687]
MARRIYISFIGTGDYKPATYSLNNRTADVSRFVQSAELQIIGPDYFDKVFLVMTESSREKHFKALRSELIKLGVENIHDISITEDLEPAHHWGWFETILSFIDHGDELTVDLTHGYRIIPIVFSTALNFLQKAKDIKIKAVYYGAFEAGVDVAPIVDAKDFYVINEWTDAVARLVEDADPGKLGRVAQKEENTNLKEFDDPELVAAFDDLTKALKNVEIHTVSEKAARAVNLIRKKEAGASTTGRILLELVKEKFISLIKDKSFTGRYDHDYFQLQLEIVKILLDHQLFMQAYTVMREMLGSFGLITMKKKAKISNEKGRKQRRKAELFIRMLQNDESEWEFSEDEKKNMVRIMPLYREMEAAGIVIRLKALTEDLTKYRNGFDHAWTKHPTAFDDIESKGNRFFQEIEDIIQQLAAQHFF